jgi:iron complex transport system permease protein
MRRLFWPALIVALVLLAVAGLALGAVRIAPSDAWRALRGIGDPSTVVIVRELRLPRVALAALVGAALAISGAAQQGVLRNPLAEPYLLGVSGGAAAGTVLALTMGLVREAGGALSLLPLAGFAGSVVAVALVLLVARAAGGEGDRRTLLMAGVVVGAFANATIMILLASAPADAVRNALWWMMGSVAGAEWRTVAMLAAWLVVGAAYLVAVARDVDVLALGQEPAAALGVDSTRTGRRVFLASALVAAASVAAAGLIGFVGLVVPHLVRRAGIHRHRALFAGSALAGATLVVGADILARTVRAPVELPLGAVTALLGVPFFVARLRRRA